MHRNIAYALAAIVLALAVTAATAKGRTVRILITGGGQSLEITDPDIVSRFSVRTGPGVRVWAQDLATREGHTGTFIDWARGKVEWLRGKLMRRQPDGLQRFDVDFYCEGASDEVCYAATYAYDPASNEGYIYVPGPGDERYKCNETALRRSAEGSWFHSSPAWERLVRPRIEQAERERTTPRTRFITPI